MSSINSLKPVLLTWHKSDDIPESGKKLLCKVSWGYDICSYSPLGFSGKPQRQPYKGRRFSYIHADIEA